MPCAVRVVVDGQTLTAQLDDNPTSTDLAELLPLTLTFRDLNGVEKFAELPRPLTTEGAPAGAAPAVNAIGYYAPYANLVFYYGQAGYWPGIVTLGHFDTDLELVHHQPDGSDVTIERA